MYIVILWFYITNLYISACVGTFRRYFSLSRFFSTAKIVMLNDMNKENAPFSVHKLKNAKSSFSNSMVFENSLVKREEIELRKENEELRMKVRDAHVSIENFEHLIEEMELKVQEAIVEKDFIIGQLENENENMVNKEKLVLFENANPMFVTALKSGLQQLRNNVEKKFSTKIQNGASALRSCELEKQKYYEQLTELRKQSSELALKKDQLVEKLDFQMKQNKQLVSSNDMQKEQLKKMQNDKEALEKAEQTIAHSMENGFHDFLQDNIVQISDLNATIEKLKQKKKAYKLEAKRLQNVDLEWKQNVESMELLRTKWEDVDRKHQKCLHQLEEKKNIEDSFAALKVDFENVTKEVEKKGKLLNDVELEKKHLIQQRNQRNQNVYEIEMELKKEMLHNYETKLAEFQNAQKGEMRENLNALSKSIESTVKHNSELDTMMEDMQKKMSLDHTNFIALQSLLRERNTALQDRNQTILAKDTALQEKSKLLDQLELKNSNLENTMGELQQKIDALTKQQTNSLNQMYNVVDVKESEIAKLQNECEAAKVKIKDKNQSIFKLKQAVSQLMHYHQSKKCNNQNLEGEAKIEALQYELDTKQSNIEKLLLQKEYQANKLLMMDYQHATSNLSNVFAS